MSHHTHSFEGHTYGHDHDEGDDPHGHSAAVAKEELAEEDEPKADKGSGEKAKKQVGDNKPDEGNAEEPDGDDEEEDDGGDGAATPVTVPSQAESPEAHASQSGTTTNAFRAHRGR